jgi:hypothetical protein
MNVRTLLAAAAMSVGFVSFAAADITGKVKLDGKAPDAKEIDMSGVAECKAAHTDPVYEEHVVADEQGNLANVVVYIKADDAAALGGEIPKEAAVLDQKGCMYEPHVLAMMVGQELKVKNDDPFLHNVHSLAQTNPAFNFGQPNKDPGKPVDPPKAAENIKVKCDVHPWMSAYIVVLEHPFFGVSKEDGTFTIKGNPPDGDYTLNAWHETLGTQEAKVTVKDGKAEVTEPITFKAQGAAAPAQDNGVRLASLQTEKKSTGDCACCTDKASAGKLAEAPAAPAQTAAAAK